MDTRSNNIAHQRQALDFMLGALGLQHVRDEEAKLFRERLLAPGALDRTTVSTPPTVVELVESITY